MTGPHSEDFTVATTISDETLIAAVAGAVGQVDDDTSIFSAADLRDTLDADHSLSAVEMEAVFVGLILNEVAERIGNASSLTEDSLVVEIDRAEAVLTEQAAARRLLDRREENGLGEQRDQQSDSDRRSTLVATVPHELEIKHPESVDDLDARLRAAMLDAENTIRVATPYFDPGHPTVEALHGLPERGLNTRILTRGVEPGTDRYDVLESMVEALDAEGRERVNVAELFVKDDSGRQAYATHAKLVVVDGTTCYLGSANFTATNLSSNFEVGMMTSASDAEVAAQLFDKVFAASSRVPLSRFR